MPERPLRIVMIAAECESLARTGGLGDVVEQLSRALCKRGHHALVVTPRYGVTRIRGAVHPWNDRVDVRVGWGAHDVRSVGVLELDRETSPSGGTMRVALVDDPWLFGDRAGIYGDASGAFGDNDYRFAVLSRAGLEIGARAWLAEGGHEPDVIHAHDWHASFAVLYMKGAMGEPWRRRPCVYSIHNLAYQGVLGEDAVDRLSLPREFYTADRAEQMRNVNMMKGAIAVADSVTTVSPTYAREIQTPEGGFGLDGHLRGHAHKLVGIANGIEIERFDPRTDPAIACGYDERTAEVGKARCKEAMFAELGLDATGNPPLFSAVTRLVGQKGVDLVLALMPYLEERGARVVLVGQGEPELESALLAVAARSPQRVAVRIAFDATLARRVYSASDFVLVPSRFEPCGLVQMYAMRYGAVPIVTRVGGLADTVQPIDPARASGTGIFATHPGTQPLREAFDAAFALYGSKAALAAARARGMRADVGWAGPADRYLDLYRSLL